jgi:hypothetical protein
MSERFYVRRNGKESGPYLIDELKNAYRSEAFRSSAELRLETGSDWFPVSRLHERLVTAAAAPSAPEQLPSLPLTTAAAPPAEKPPRPKKWRTAESEPEFGSTKRLAAIYSALGYAELVIGTIAAVGLGLLTESLMAGAAVLAAAIISGTGLLAAAELLKAAAVIVRNSCEIRDAANSVAYAAEE